MFDFLNPKKDKAMDEASLCLTRKQFAKKLRTSEATLSRLEARGLLVRVSGLGKVLYSRANLAQFFKESIPHAEILYPPSFDFFPKKIYTIEEVAKNLNLSVSTIGRVTTKGELHAIKCLRRRRYSDYELSRFLNSKKSSTDGTKK